MFSQGIQFVEREIHLQRFPLPDNNRVMTKEKNVLCGGGLGQNRKPGSGAGRGSGYHGRGHGHASGHGRGHDPGRGKGSAGRGRGRGQGRGRASEALYRSEQCGGGSRLDGNSAQKTGPETSWPHKQQSISGLHQLLVGPRGIARGYVPTKPGTDQTPLDVGRRNRRGGRLSWTDMRRQSQRSNSTTDDSSEPDGSHRALLHIGGPEGGWGGRGRGRLLDVSSTKKSDCNEDNINTSGWSGRGRGGILYVPGVYFQSGRGVTGQKHSGTSDCGILNLRHSVGGGAKYYALQSSQLQRKEGVTAHSSNWKQNKYQGWKKKTKDNECKIKSEPDNLQPLENTGKRDSHTKGTSVPRIQLCDEKSIGTVEKTEGVQWAVSEIVTCEKKQIVDIISHTEDDNEKLLDDKQSKLNNIEENLQKQLMIGTDEVSAYMQKSVVPVNCASEQKSITRLNYKPIHYSPRGGRSRGTVLFGAISDTDGGTSDPQNADVCERGIEEKPSEPQILKPENSCIDKVCGAVV